MRQEPANGKTGTWSILFIRLFVCLERERGCGREGEHKCEQCPVGVRKLILDFCLVSNVSLTCAASLCSTPGQLATKFPGHSPISASHLAGCHPCLVCFCLFVLWAMNIELRASGLHGYIDWLTHLPSPTVRGFVRIKNLLQIPSGWSRGGCWEDFLLFISPLPVLYSALSPPIPSLLPGTRAKVWGMCFTSPLRSAWRNQVRQGDTCLCRPGSNILAVWVGAGLGKLRRESEEIWIPFPCQLCLWGRAAVFVLQFLP